MRIAILAVAMSLACSGAFQSQDVHFELAGDRVSILESGAIIVGRRQVATVDGKGKIKASLGQLLAWVYEDAVQLKGGVSLPIRTDAEGTIYIPEDAQKKANLKPMTKRAKKNGNIALGKNSEGKRIKGNPSAKNRRLLLVVLLLAKNDMFKK